MGSNLDLPSVVICVYIWIIKLIVGCIIYRTGSLEIKRNMSPDDNKATDLCQENIIKLLTLVENWTYVTLNFQSSALVGLAKPLLDSPTPQVPTIVCRAPPHLLETPPPPHLTVCTC